MSREEVIKLIREFLEANFQMTIATYGKHPWIATVYYSVDHDLKIYFLSDPKTIHCQQIAANPQVAISIADSPQKPNVHKKGLQVYGLAEEIGGQKKMTHAINLWRKTLGVTSEKYTYEGMMSKAIKGRMYGVTIKKIKFFNEALWKEGTEPVIEFE